MQTLLSTTALSTASTPAPRKSYKPPPIDPANPPPRIPRKVASPFLLAALGFPVSPRTLESWPVATKLVNGKATFDTAELLAYARSKVDAAPVIQGGRTPAPQAA